MLYIVRPNDTLHSIASRFGSTIQEIRSQNVICHPDMIISGMPLIIPKNGVDLPLAGGSPYYIVSPGDSLQCLALYFHTTEKNLIETNQLYSPVEIGRELLIGIQQHHPKDLYEMWKKAGDTEWGCSSASNHEVFYRGSYEWEAIGDAGIPYLAELLEHPCSGITMGAIEGLGRIASSNTQKTLTAYVQTANEPLYIDLARVALERILIVQQTKNKRFHVTTNDWMILHEPKSGSHQTNIPKGTVVVGLRWNIPSPYYEEGPKGGLQMFDYIKIVETGQTGFLPRVGYNAIWLI
ncbi:LysM peptidoglycan-binding domain-containing protein [Halalkalibacter alkaliphilus]|uniref:LysM peptidoglycan-binding domain-containing protein n=1 Tax=Halalkalibacter alkaliphilus TaxID=2917993 RepID=A0A9X2CWD0_9BACI|nr:LysM peptidoglycan-binding domain-containing protein [Halalkalibacter alkaliphilus]MCL7749561.1 LysM peptidoglycan-binding domain-containing protein [Halalkalibacter alkaliphilus]